MPENAHHALTELVSSLGFHGKHAEMLVHDAASRLMAIPEPRRSTDLLTALSDSLVRLGEKLPEVLADSADHTLPTPLRNDPEDGIEIPGYGRVHRGTKDFDGRPYIYAWLKRDPHSPCVQACWYSLVWPELSIDSEDETKNVGTIRSATEIDTHFGQWSPDYEKKVADDEDARRKAAGAPPQMGLDLVDGQRAEPEGTTIDDPHHPHVHVVAKPYPERGIPGTHQDPGFVDSPEWATRGKDGAPSPAEEIARRVKAKRFADITASSKPPDSTMTLEFHMHFHTYLWCVNPRKCLGWFEWDSWETVTITIEWVDSGKVELGMNQTRWKSGTRVSSSYRLTVEDWNTC